MTKKDLIKQEITGITTVVSAHQGFTQEGEKSYGQIVVVDIDKLSEFLAKHLKIENKDLID